MNSDGILDRLETEEVETDYIYDKFEEGEDHIYNDKRTKVPELFRAPKPFLSHQWRRKH